MSKKPFCRCPQEFEKCDGTCWQQKMPVKHASSKENCEGLSIGAIHRLSEQVLMDAMAFGMRETTREFPAFNRQQLIFVLGVLEEMGSICYDAGFYYASGKDAE